MEIARIYGSTDRKRSSVFSFLRRWTVAVNLITRVGTHAHSWWYVWKFTTIHKQNIHERHQCYIRITGIVNKQCVCISSSNKYYKQWHLHPVTSWLKVIVQCNRFRYLCSQTSIDLLLNILFYSSRLLHAIYKSKLLLLLSI